MNLHNKTEKILKILPVLLFLMSLGRSHIYTQTPEEWPQYSNSKWHSSNRCEITLILWHLQLGESNHDCSRKLCVHREQGLNSVLLVQVCHKVTDTSPLWMSSAWFKDGNEHSLFIHWLSYKILPIAENRHCINGTLCFALSWGFPSLC